MTLRMEELQKPVTENIISLTLEVITLLTGEDYAIVKRCGDRGAPPVLKLENCLPTRHLEGDKKILETTNKIIHLLTGEVWKFLAAVKIEEHRESSDCSKMKAAPDDIKIEPMACPEWELQHNEPSISKHESDDDDDDEMEDGGSFPGDDEDSKTFHLELDVLPITNEEQTLDQEEKFHPGDQKLQSDQTQPAEEQKFTAGENTSLKAQPEEEQKLTPGENTSLKAQPEVCQPKDEPVEQEINSTIPDLTQNSGGISGEVSEESSPAGSENKEAQPVAQIEIVLQEDNESSNPNMQVDDATSGSEPGKDPENPAQGTSNEPVIDVPKPTPQSDKIHKCQKCQRAFSTYYHLVNHQKVHEPSKSFLCPECGKCFNRKSVFDIHLRIHTGEKPFVCLECNKAFVAKDRLTQHQRLHTGEKPYCCAVCGMSYRIKQSLLLHQRSHTGEKPYSCETCGKCFTTSSSLGHHRKVHTVDKPHACAECAKTLVQSCQTCLCSHSSSQ